MLETRLLKKKMSERNALQTGSSFRCAKAVSDFVLTGF